MIKSEMLLNGKIHSDPIITVLNPTKDVFYCIFKFGAIYETPFMSAAYAACESI